MRRALPAVAALALALTPVADGGRQGSDTLQLNADFTVTASSTACPSGEPSTTFCFAFTGGGTVPGLGTVTDRHTALSDESNPSCIVLDFTPDVITVAGKGEIDSMITTSASCNGIPTGFVVTGGSGAYAGASGGGTFTPSPVSNGAWNDNGDDAYPDDDDFDGWRSDTWKGTITVAGLSFDLTPPVISGAVSRTVRVRTGRRARVKFTVSAVDAVDGAVSTRCAPRSGSFFRIGRTRVTCTATDSSANTATAHFTVTVKSAHR